MRVSRAAATVCACSAVLSGLLLRPVAACATEARSAIPSGGPQVDQVGHRSGTLANGLSYFVERRPDPEKKISFRLLVRVGDAQAYPRERNVAHVVEHIVMANSASGEAGASTWDILRRFGGVPGADGNANTGLASTSYYVKMPSDDPLAFAAALGILHDWIAPRPLSDEEIARERAAVAEESRRAGADPAFDVKRSMRFATIPAFQGLKSEATGEVGTTADAIRALHAIWYTPRNMAVVVVGDVNPDEVVDALAARLGSVPAGSASPAPIDLHMPTARGGAFLPLPRSAPSETVLDIYYHYRLAPSGTPERVREVALARLAAPLLLNAARNLGEREDAPALGYGVSPTDIYSIAELTGIQSVWMQATARQGAVRGTLFDCLNLVATLRREGFAAEDVERARTAVLAELARGEPSTGAAERWTTFFLRGAFDPTSAELSSVLVTITPAELNAAIGEWLAPEHRDIVVTYPESDSATIPSASELPGLAAEAELAPPVALSPPPIVAPALSPFAPPPVSPVKGEQAGAGYLRWTLPRSKATLLFKRTDTGSVFLDMARPGGAARFDRTKAVGALAASQIVRWSGLGGLDRFGFSRFAASRGIELFPTIGFTREGLHAAGPSAEWPLIMGLARAQLLQPQCREAAFTAYVAQRQSGLALSDAAAADRAAFNSAIEQALGDPPRADVASLSTLDFRSVCEQYSHMLSDTQGMTIVVEGDLPPVWVYSSVAAALDLPAAASAPTLRNAPLIQTRAGREVMERGVQPLASVALIVQRRRAGDARAGQLVARILGQRMNSRLREAERGTYVVDAEVIEADNPDRTTLSIRFDCDPLNVDRLIAAAKEELATLAADGVSREELAADRRIGTAALSAPDLVDVWRTHRSLTALPPVTDAAVRGWIERHIELSRLREFVRIPRSERETSKRETSTGFRNEVQ